MEQSLKKKKKKWLWRYRNKMFIAESLWRQAEEWKSVICDPSSRVLDGLPKSPGFKADNEMTRFISDYPELIEEAKTATKEAKEVRREILKVINQIDNILGIKVLTLRYIEGLDWEEIYDEMNYCKQHVLRIHKEALDNLEIV